LHATQIQRLSTWRAKAASGALTLGSFVATASQLPVFLLRKQGLVERLAGGQQLDPAVIGVHGRHEQWLLFYDVDDLLGYPTRHLYAPRTGIREIQVDSSDLFHDAHTRYWKEGGTVVERAARFILANALRA
jgi:hypothetical protein